MEEFRREGNIPLVGFDPRGHQPTGGTEVINVLEAIDPRNRLYCFKCEGLN